MSNCLETPGGDSSPEEPFDERQWWESTVVSLDAILEQLGQDRSTDSRNLWDAEWSSYELQKKFYLRRYTVPRNGQEYALVVYSYADGQEESRYKFNSKDTGICAASGKDVTEANGLDDYAKFIRFLDGRVTRYLNSSKVGARPVTPPESASLSEEEEKEFTDIVVRYISGDERLAWLIENGFTAIEFGRIFRWMSRILSFEYGVSEELAAKAIAIQEEALRQGQVNGQA